jgi:hypothetical protein
MDYESESNVSNMRKSFEDVKSKSENFLYGNGRSIVFVTSVIFILLSIIVLSSYEGDSEGWTKFTAFVGLVSSMLLFGVGLYWENY